jgi:hypothetical protein
MYTDTTYPIYTIDGMLSLSLSLSLCVSLFHPLIEERAF